MLGNRNFWDVSHPKQMDWRGQVPPSPSYLAFDAIARFFHTIYTSFSEAIHLIFWVILQKGSLSRQKRIYFLKRYIKDIEWLVI